MTATSLRYDFFSPPRIAFGWGRRAEAGSLAAALGARAFVVSGSRTLERNGTLEALRGRLLEAGVRTVPLATIAHEPEVSDVDGAVAALQEHGPGAGDFVLAVGGGSAIDLAKAVAALATNLPRAPGGCEASGNGGHVRSQPGSAPSAEDRSPASVADYLEGVGRGLKIAEPPLPLMAIPTTAGTGTEATKNAVISSYDPPFKKSLRSDLMVPRVVLVDPELTVSLPAATTAHTGMDAVTQLIESSLSRRAQPIPQSLCREGLAGAPQALIEAVEDGTSRSAREKMAHAALLSGMALANSGLGLAHGVAAALGVHCRVPHGLACAVMLPAAMRANRAVREAELARLAPLLTGRDWPNRSAAADAAIGGIQETALRVGIPQRLSEIGVTAEQIPALVRSSRGNSMDGNPRPLSDDELARLLTGIL